jgi:exosortase D (VPLPA-CTERM-specific)
MSSSTRQILRCEEAGEFVCALCDGESIPPAAAEHVGTCETCQSRLKDYGAIGTELRRVASLEPSAEARARTWETRQRVTSSWWERGWALMALLPLTVWLYASILAHLFLQWMNDKDFSHGIVVPIFAFYVIWQERKHLTAIAPAPSWTGLPLVVLSMIVFVLGVLGADIFLPRMSLLILLAGLVILFQGWKFFRAVLFPWAFLILMIPIPALIMNRITFPLQLLAAKLAAALLEMVGVVVHRGGNILTLASEQRLDVAEACSGIRSLLTLITLAIIYGYFMETRKWVRVVLVCLTVPIAVIANSFRVFGTALLMQHGYIDEAEGVPHALAGLLIFAVALTLLFAVHRVISRIWKGAPAATHKIANLEEQPPWGMRVKAGSFNSWVVAGLMLATAIGLQTHSGAKVKHVGSLPWQIGSWTGEDAHISQDELDILGPGEYLQRNYENASEPEPINLYIPFFPSQKAGDTIHSPDHCLLGAGWFPISRDVIQLPRPDGSSIPVMRFVVSKSGQRDLVLYWFQSHGRVVASEWRAKYFLICDSIRMNRSDGGMVRLMTPMLKGESPDAAQARLMKFGSQLLPLLDSYMPR